MPLVFFSFKNNIFEYDKVLVNTAVLAGTLPDESTRISKIVDQSLDVKRVSLQRKIIPHKKTEAHLGPNWPSSAMRALHFLRAGAQRFAREMIQHLIGIKIAWV